MFDILKRSLRRRDGGRDAGAVAIEFAFLMAFVPLAVMAVGIVDYGEVMGQATNLAAVVRGAAEYARGQVVQGNALPSAANLSTLLGVPAEMFNPPTWSFCTCADGSMPPPLPTCPNSSNPCATSPPANGDMRVLKYVAVSGSQSYQPLIFQTLSFSVNTRTVLRTQ